MTCDIIASSLTICNLKELEEYKLFIDKLMKEEFCPQCQEKFEDCGCVQEWVKELYLSVKSVGIHS